MYNKVRELETKILFVEVTFITISIQSGVRFVTKVGRSMTKV